MIIDARRPVAVTVGLLAGALIVAGCGTGDGAAAPSSPGASATSSAPAAAPHSTSARSTAAAASVQPVKLQGVNGTTVTLTGPIAARYTAATAAEKKALGAPLDGSRNAGARESGVVFQQFKGGVITARNANAGTPAYITWGKIREAWNVERDAAGNPVTVGANGSVGPLGAVTSEETAHGDLRTTTFEHGKVVFNTRTGKVEVTVGGKIVPSGL